VTEIVIRRAAPDDYAGVCRLLDETDDVHRPELPWLVVKPPEGVSRPREYFEPFYQGTRCVAIVAEGAPDGLVGVVLALLTHTEDFPVIRPARYGVLDVIGVRESHRRRGIGERLVRAAEEWALAGGAEWLQLGVYEFNQSAQRFYEKLGYAVISRKLRKPL
jgi:GNAT superfamily N-acetyltransferase